MARAAHAGHFVIVMAHEHGAHPAHDRGPSTATRERYLVIQAFARRRRMRSSVKWEARCAPVVGPMWHAVRQRRE